MTDRYNSLTIVLEHDIREDDAEALISAIYQLRGVLKVSGNVADVNQFIAESRVKNELRSKVLDIFRDRDIFEQSLGR